MTDAYRQWLSEPIAYRGLRHGARVGHRSCVWAAARSRVRKRKRGYARD